MHLDSTLLTIDWLNRELDKINIKTDYIDSMIQETEDQEILEFLEKKLFALEKECIDIGAKIDFEKKQLLTVVGELK
jgi:SMC interacting uncharacterized protein involved in chromosome segregation